jgi:hypothetical protein
VHVIACRLVIAGGFLQGNELVAVEIGGQPHEASHILTFFPLSKTSPMHIVLIESNLSLALYYLCMCYLCTTYRVLYDDVICCMIVNFHIYLLL